MSGVIDISDDESAPSRGDVPRDAYNFFNIDESPAFGEDTEGEVVPVGRLGGALQQLLDPDYLGPFYIRSDRINKFILGPVKMSFNSSRFYSAINVTQEMVQCLKQNGRAVGFCVNPENGRYFWPRNFSMSVNNATSNRPEPRFTQDSQFFWANLSNGLHAGQNGIHLYGNQQNLDGFFYFAIRMFRELTDMDIVHLVERQEPFTREEWGELFRKTIENDGDVCFARNEVSLTCPLGLWRLQVPVRSIHCLHLSCFDLVAFAKFQREAGDWKCPICGCKSRLDDLRVDSCMVQILAEAPETVETVEVTEEGKFSCRMPAESD